MSATLLSGTPSRIRETGMAVQATFVGGPLDGMVLSVDQVRPEYRVPMQPPVVFTGTADAARPSTMPVVTYKLDQGLLALLGAVVGNATYRVAT